MSRSSHILRPTILGVALLTALTGCLPKEEQVVNDAAEKLRVAEQMWKAEGTQGLSPTSARQEFPRALRRWLERRSGSS